MSDERKIADAMLAKSREHFMGSDANYSRVHDVMAHLTKRAQSFVSVECVVEVLSAIERLSASKPAAQGWKLAMVERSYDMRAKAIIAFNTAERAGEDRDDALDAAWQAMLAASPAAPAQSGDAVAWRHSKTLCLYETEEDVPLADGDEHAEPLYTAICSIDGEEGLLAQRERDWDEGWEEGYRHGLQEAVSPDQAMATPPVDQLELVDMLDNNVRVLTDLEAVATGNKLPGIGVVFVKTKDTLLRARTLIAAPQPAQTAVSASVHELLEALESIRQYGLDTLSGRADGGLDDRAWQREAVNEMTKRARIAMEKSLAAPQPSQPVEDGESFEQTLVHHANLDGYSAGTNELFHYKNGWHKAMRVNAAQAAVVLDDERAAKPSPEKSEDDECDHQFEPFKPGLFICVKCHQVQTVEQTARALTGDAQATASPRLIEAARQVEVWWDAEGKHRFDGAPAAMFNLRDALSVVPQATSTLMDEDRIRVRDAIAKAIGGDAYDCMRVWEAWRVGTMTDDDFHPIIDDDERLSDIADAAISAISAASTT